MTLQLGQETIAIHILPSISRRQDNQTMRFDQLIEHNMISISLEKLYTKCGGDGETSFRPFSKNHS